MTHQPADVGLSIGTHTCLLGSPRAINQRQGNLSSSVVRVINLVVIDDSRRSHSVALKILTKKTQQYFGLRVAEAFSVGLTVA